MGSGKRTFRQLLAKPWLPAGVGRTPYLWAMSLSFFVWKYFYVRSAALELACAVLTVAVFLPLYFASYRMRNRRAVPAIVVTIMLGLAWMPYNPGASTFFIFAAAMCARFDSPRVAYAAVAVILVLACCAALAAQHPLIFLIPVLAVGGPVGVGSIMDRRLRDSHEALLRKQDEIEHLARIAERERISRDLHDLLGHTLSMITLKAELAGRLFERDSTASRKEVKDIEDSARHALAEVRAAVTGYRASGFAHELARARAALAAAAVELSADVHPAPLPPTVESVLALALREAVTNILRHARASRCEVRVALEDGSVVCRISDDGSALDKADGIRPGNGLHGMQERVAALGGQLAVSVGRGLALELRLPMGGAQ